MQMMKDKARWAMVSLLAVLCLALMALMAPLTARAAEAVDTGKDDCTLSIQHAYDGSALQGATFKIYRVASLSAESEISVVDPFDKYEEIIPALGMSQDDWQKYAQTLAGYVARDGIEPKATVTTDTRGNASFTGLRTGIYLVTASNVYKGDYTYVVNPYMVSIPTMFSDQNKWNYNVTSKTKITRYYTPAADPTIDLTIAKTWNDVGHEDARPATITIDLMCDDQMYETVELSATNGWTHEWKSLNAKHTWTVAEREVSGYTVKVTKNDYTFVIENTFDTSEDPGDGPGDDDPGDEPGDEPGDDDGDDDPGVTPGGDGGGSGGSGGKLPQTGMLWWPVAVLVVAGLGLILVGVLRRRQA